MHRVVLLSKRRLVLILAEKHYQVYVNIGQAGRVGSNFRTLPNSLVVVFEGILLLGRPHLVIKLEKQGDQQETSEPAACMRTFFELGIAQLVVAGVR